MHGCIRYAATTIRCMTWPTRMYIPLSYFQHQTVVFMQLMRQTDAGRMIQLSPNDLGFRVSGLGFGGSSGASNIHDRDRQRVHEFLKYRGMGQSWKQCVCAKCFVGIWAVQQHQDSGVCQACGDCAALGSRLSKSKRESLTLSTSSSSLSPPSPPS